MDSCSTQRYVLKNEVNLLVSVIVPVYNAEKTLARCVDSILEQSFRNLEIILVDDGSSDESLTLCRQYAEKDQRVRTYSITNRGAGEARNYGLEKAGGAYVFFADADDYVLQNGIEKMVAATENGEISLVAAGYQLLNQNDRVTSQKMFEFRNVSGKELRSDYSECLLKEGKWFLQGALWNKLFSMKIVRANAVKFPPMYRREDEVFISRFIQHAENIRFLDEVVYAHYSNDLTTLWRKLPPDYMNIIQQLQREREQTVLTWNPQDAKTRAIVQKEYICNVILMMELAFSPKYNLHGRQRRKWMNDMARQGKLSEQKNWESNPFLGRYQRIILSKLEKGHSAYHLIACKVWLTKCGLLNTVKKIVRGI